MNKIQNLAFELSELLSDYKNTNTLSRKDFAELTLMLLEYWSLEDDLSSAFASASISFDIEEKIIELEKEYSK